MDFSDQIDARSPDLRARVVFMTGGAFTPRASAFVEKNADRCVDKPFDIIEDIEERLSRARA
jgi:CheY-like chemotaxis protein